MKLQLKSMDWLKCSTQQAQPLQIERQKQNKIITSCCNGWGGGEDGDSEEVEEVESWRSSTKPRYFKALSPESTQVTA